MGLLLNNISLTAGMGTSVLALQDINGLFNTTETHLATGKAVNTALDDPIKYFAAQNDTFAATNFATLKSSMNEALQTIQAANNAITSITTLVKNAIATAQSAQAAASTDYATQTTLLNTYQNILTQINQAGADAKYGGKNLINNGTYTNSGASGADSMTVYFNSANTNSSLTLSGVNTTVVGLGLYVGGTVLSTANQNATTGVVSAAGSTATGDVYSLAASSANSWAVTANITSDINNLQTALTTLKTTSQTLSGNNAVIQARIDFTSNMIGTLQTGASNLTVADMNQEGSNMLALQTQQALAVNSLRLASQASQGVLRLFS